MFETKHYFLQVVKVFALVFLTLSFLCWLFGFVGFACFGFLLYFLLLLFPISSFYVLVLVYVVVGFLGFIMCYLWICFFAFVFF